MNNVCTICKCTCACVLACAHQWLGGMERIPRSRLCRRKDLGGGDQVPGCRGVTVKAQRRRRNEFYTTSTFHMCNVCLHVFAYCGFLSWQCESSFPCEQQNQERKGTNVFFPLLVLSVSQIKKHTVQIRLCNLNSCKDSCAFLKGRVTM